MKTSPKKKPADQYAAKSVIKRGKKAIAAARLNTSKPKPQQQEEEREDAHRWRNEG